MINTKIVVSFPLSDSCEDEAPCSSSSMPVHVEPSYFVGLSSQVMSFVDSINLCSKCDNKGCQGKLVAKSFQNKGLGGALSINFGCNGCTGRLISFDSTTRLLMDNTRRNQVSLALHLAMYLAGCHYDKISKSLKLGLGLQVLHETNFYEIIKTIYPITKDMLEDMCNEAKDEMKAIPDDALGSFKRAITTSDGAWLTRGHHSKNFTFHVKNFITQSLLYYMHLCQKGNDDICEEQLYQGTSKSSEGYAAEKCFKAAADDGMNVEVNWQDGDSSSANGFYKAYNDRSKSKVMLCGGHVTRAHGKQLEVLAGQKTLSAAYISKHKVKYPNIKKVSCVCKDKRHSKGCGCMSDHFVRQARINHSLALIEAGKEKSPDKYAQILNELGQHHARNEHSWGDQQCSFHAKMSCSCGNCDEDDLQIKCEGKVYTTKNVLTCPMHQLAYEIECNERASRAQEVIHPDFGRGHSNLPEADHHIFTKFRAKDQNLQRLHYITSTNFGLMQSNMKWLRGKRGPDYHWIIELYKKLGLPVYKDIVEALVASTQESEKTLVHQQKEETKKKRIANKRARLEENEERKRWLKEQKANHTYGSIAQEEVEEDKEASALINRDNEGSDVPAGTIVVSNTVRACKCGAVTHKRVTHKDCPLNKKPSTSDKSKK